MIVSSLSSLCFACGRCDWANDSGCGFAWDLLSLAFGLFCLLIRSDEERFG